MKDRVKKNSAGDRRKDSLTRPSREGNPRMVAPDSVSDELREMEGGIMRGAYEDLLTGPVKRHFSQRDNEH